MNLTCFLADFLDRAEAIDDGDEVENGDVPRKVAQAPRIGVQKDGNAEVLDGERGEGVRLFDER